MDIRKSSEKSKWTEENDVYLVISTTNISSSEARSLVETNQFSIVVKTFDDSCFRNVLLVGL